MSASARTPAFVRECADEGFARFARAVARHGAWEPDADYLRGARVFWMRRGARDIGGFCTSRPPTRALTLMPEAGAEALRATLADEGAGLGDIGEVSCVWAAPDATWLERFLLWERALRDVRRSGVRFVVAYVRKPGLARIYRRGAPRVIHEGEARIVGGRAEQDTVMLFTSAQLLRALAWYLPGRWADAARKSWAAHPQLAWGSWLVPAQRLRPAPSAARVAPTGARGIR